jgi:hypothetical protein
MDWLSMVTDLGGWGFGAGLLGLRRDVEAMQKHYAFKHNSYISVYPYIGF